MGGHPVLLVAQHVQAADREETAPAEIERDRPATAVRRPRSQSRNDGAVPTSISPRTATRLWWPCLADSMRATAPRMVPSITPLSPSVSSPGDEGAAHQRRRDRGRRPAGAPPRAARDPRDRARRHRARRQPLARWRARSRRAARSGSRRSTSATAPSATRPTARRSTACASPRSASSTASRPTSSSPASTTARTSATTSRTRDRRRRARGHRPRPPGVAISQQSPPASSTSASAGSSTSRTPREFAARIVAELDDVPLQPGTLLNINVPGARARGRRGHPARQAHLPRRAEAQRGGRRAARRYWIYGDAPDYHDEPGTDLAAVAAGASR